MKKVLYSVLISIIVVLMLSVKVFGFENKVYKIDIPSTYKEIAEGESSVFTNPDGKIIMIYSQKMEGLKKDFSTMSKSEIDDLVKGLVGSATTIVSQEKDKLGKSKAIKIRVKSSKSEEYMDMYIVASDKHVLIVSFATKQESELASKELVNIKKSFVMKEKTTNVTLIRVLEIAIIAAGIGFGIYRKRKRV